MAPADLFFGLLYTQILCRIYNRNTFSLGEKSKTEFTTSIGSVTEDGPGVSIKVYKSPITKLA